MEQHRSNSFASFTLVGEEIKDSVEKLKKTYVTPKLTTHGDVAAITQSTAVGTRLDRALPAGSSLSLVLSSLSS